MANPITKLVHVTRQHKKFVEGLADGLKPGAASVYAGFSRDYGKTLAKAPEIRNLLHQRLEERGLNEDKIAEKLTEGLEAMAPPRRDGGTLYPDNFVRKQYLDLLCRIRGDYAPEKTEHLDKRIQIVLDRGMIEALRDTDAITVEEADVLDAEIVNG